MSKKQAREMAELKRKSRRMLLTFAIAAATLVIVLIIAYLVFFNGSGGTGKIWHLDSAGLLAFDARPQVSANVSRVEATQNWTLDKVSYPGFGDDVYALLRVPRGVSKPPVVIVLPAASINKEDDAAMAKALCSWGYASLTLDERGNDGETPGPSAMDLDSGYSTFVSGGDPAQYKQIYDVLPGYDYVRSRADLDGDDVAVLGESMGGRFAIVAAALEPRLKAALAVSTGPYGIKGDSETSTRFLKSIEPASYLSTLPPRKVAFFHFSGDTIIPVAYGRQLYDAASQPKAWHQYDGTVHGLYSDVYASDLHDELRSVFGR